MKITAEILAANIRKSLLVKRRWFGIGNDLQEWKIIRLSPSKLRVLIQQVSGAKVWKEISNLADNYELLEVLR